jgi:hypothetical protein
MYLLITKAILMIRRYIFEERSVIRMSKNYYRSTVTTVEDGNDIEGKKPKVNVKG